MNEHEIYERVKALYPDAIIDIDGANCNFSLFVLSEAFNGLNTLQRQKPILSLFSKELASGKLHALSIKAKTPGEQSQQTGLIQINL